MWSRKPEWRKRRPGVAPVATGAGGRSDGRTVMVQKYLFSGLLRPFSGRKAKEGSEECGQKSSGGRNEKKMKESYRCYFK